MLRTTKYVNVKWLERTPCTVECQGRRKGDYFAALPLGAARRRDGDKNCTVLYGGTWGESTPVDGDTVKGGKIAILWRACEGGHKEKKGTGSQSTGTALKQYSNLDNSELPGTHLHSLVKNISLQQLCSPLFHFVSQNSG